MRILFFWFGMVWMTACGVTEEPLASADPPPESTEERAPPAATPPAPPPPAVPKLGSMPDTCRVDADCEVSTYTRCCQCKCPKIRALSSAWIETQKFRCAVSSCAACQSYSVEDGTTVDYWTACPKLDTTGHTATCVDNTCILSLP